MPRSVRRGSAFGHDRFRVQFLAGRERYAGRAPILHFDPAYLDSRTNLRAGRSSSRCKRRSQRTQPSAHEALGAIARTHPHQQNGGAAGGSRPERRAEDASRRDGGAQGFRLEPFRDEIRGRHRRPSQQAVGILLPETAEPAAHHQQRPQIRVRGLLDFRGRASHDAADERPQAFERLAKIRVAPCILFGECGDAVRRVTGVAAEPQTAAVQHRGKEIGIGLDQLQAVIGQSQLRHQPRCRLCRVRECRDAEAWVNLVSNRGAANAVTRFEHERLRTAAGEEGGRRQPIVASSDQDDVGHLRISRAAFLPGAPMMPPPGCVAEPHI